ncbi:MAG TPA: chemotaxis protein CheC [Methanothermococcus okinawensis]|uniref:Chemotaxis protein CheC n=1 Tax=Methanofervidicoccus abyssi TaxID=2082189 RepID=A0A401HRT0_9EURY|nr:chemotaxis protein CheC [Methanofervidicoccus abyssi]GBF36933.1 chemotaxis protein CheC [Methanofervidicoccus abyssi]HIP16361.1 chemotaxis protein CheC [Methanothermococcus okinawensis]
MGILESMRRLINIGREASENIAKSFTELTGETTDVQFLGVRFTPLEFLAEQFDDRIYKVVRIDFEGVLTGKSLMLLPEEDAVKLEKMLLIDILWDSLVNRSELPDYKEMEVSLMGEVANIVVASFLNVFANALNSEINITTPEFVKDSGFSVVESLVVEMAEKIDIALIFDNKITILEKYPINCNILILIDPETIEQLDNL